MKPLLPLKTLDAILSRPDAVQPAMQAARTIQDPTDRIRSIVDHALANAPEMQEEKDSEATVTLRKANVAARSLGLAILALVAGELPPIGALPGWRKLRRCETGKDLLAMAQDASDGLTAAMGVVATERGVVVNNPLGSDPYRGVRGLTQGDRKAGALAAYCATVRFLRDSLAAVADDDHVEARARELEQRADALPARQGAAKKAAA